MGSGNVRTAVRAVILHGDKVLVQKEVGAEYYAFIGGGYEFGDTFEERVAAELLEETTARLVSWRYLFVVENQFMVGSVRLHALEHFGLVTIDREDVRSREDHLTQEWLPVSGLKDVDLRPFQVRDLLADGTLESVKHLVVRGWVDRAEEVVRPRE